MKNNKENPLTPAILQILRSVGKPLAIHELLQELKAVTKLPILDDDVQMALFKLNWLMMNALYQLQLELVQDGFLLKISTLDIHLESVTSNSEQSTSQEISAQPLRDYYLDWTHFSETTKEEVQALLDGVWQDYIGDFEQNEAYEVLGLETDASFSMIRKTYRKLAGRYHPDKGGDSEKFMQIREAYEVLRKVRA